MHGKPRKMASNVPQENIFNSSMNTETSESDCIEDSKFHVRSTPGCPWYRNHCFDTYWQHYANALSWIQTHRQLQQEQQHQQDLAQYIYSSMMYSLYAAQQPGYNASPNSSSVPTQQPGSQTTQHEDRHTNTHVTNKQRTNSGHRKRRNRCKSAMRRKISLESCDAEHVSAVTSENEVMDTDGSFEMNMSEDFLKFLQKSEQHRRERDAKKTENTTDNMNADHDYVQIEEVSMGKSKATTLPPSQRPGFRRTQEMKFLYGDGAAKIHGMETAMQLNYDRNVDKKQPKHWPNMPLKLKL